MLRMFNAGGLISQILFIMAKNVTLNLFQGLAAVRFRNKFGMTFSLSLNNIWWKFIYSSLNAVLAKVKKTAIISLWK